MSITKKTSLYAMLIMVMLVVAACGQKADNNEKDSNEPAATETTTGAGDTKTDDTDKTEAPNEDKAEPSNEDNKESGKTKNVNLGTTKKGSYTNDYFGVSLKFPKTWEYQDAETMNEIINDTAKEYAGDDKMKQKAFERSQAKTLNLLMISQYPLEGDQVGASVGAVAEKVSLLQGVRTGKDYLKATKEVMKVMGDGLYTDYKDFTKETIGGKEMDLMEIKIDAGDGSTITQEYMSTIINGYAFNFIFTYVDDASKSEIEKIKKSIQFK